MKTKKKALTLDTKIYMPAEQLVRARRLFKQFEFYSMLPRDMTLGQCERVWQIHNNFMNPVEK